MKLRLLSITHKTPSWIEEGYREYAKRLPLSCALTLVEIPAEKRGTHSSIERLWEIEGKKMLAAIHPQHYIIALDIKGQAWNTEQLAAQLNNWQHMGKNIDLLIGGPEGLAPACLQAAHAKWSLSPLTFPHFLVKVLIAEQIYRAWSILSHHPYHK